MTPEDGRPRGLSDGLLLTLLGGLTAILLLQSAYQTLRLWDDGVCR